MVYEAYRAFYKTWKTGTVAKAPKSRRYRLVEHLVGEIRPGNSVLEIGCGCGADFIQFLPAGCDAWGVDIKDERIERTGFHFRQVDAEALPFEDKSFDLVVSFGVLEHIKPVEKLCRVVSEIDRVARRYCIVVPAVSTPIEPHAVSPFWQLRGSGRKREMYPVNYYSDEAWLSFEGFLNARIRRFWYLPGLIRNLALYKR